jgi:chromosome segregation ATPase
MKTEEPYEYSHPPSMDQPISTAVAPIASAVPERNSSTSTVALSPVVNGPLQQQPQQLERERKLERRCRELEDRLRQAEARTQVLEDAAALSQVALANSERDAMDRLREEFQEKEARLLAAAGEDHEQELRFLKNDAEIQVQSLRQEMAQERDVFEREREYFEQLVAEANARAEQAERQFQRERTRQESTMSQSQKQHDREVQMRAEKLAETMALLDEREDQVSKLKALVQSLQSKLSEHAEGAQLAEDEVEELHHENEELRQAVKRLDVTCKDLQKKNSELHADSNKLSELKVRTGL